jgi:hypothetical protein
MQIESASSTIINEKKMELMINDELIGKTHTFVYGKIHTCKRVLSKTSVISTKDGQVKPDHLLS